MYLYIYIQETDLKVSKIIMIFKFDMLQICIEADYVEDNGLGVTQSSEEFCDIVLSSNSLTN